MRTTLDRVREFHVAFERYIPDHPVILPGTTNQTYALQYAATALVAVRDTMRAHAAGDARLQRVALIAEELGELADALAQRDKVATLDALVDIDYVVAGGFLDFGFDAVAVESQERVHTSNMSKLGADGRPIVEPGTAKVTKGPSYVPVDLADLVGS